MIFRHIPCILAFRVFTTPLLYALVHLFIYASLSFFSWAFGVVLWEICTLGKNISCRLLESHRASSEYRSRQLAKLFFSKNVLTKTERKTFYGINLCIIVFFPPVYFHLFKFKNFFCGMCLPRFVYLRGHSIFISRGQGSEGFPTCRKDIGESGQLCGRYVRFSLNDSCTLGTAASSWLSGPEYIWMTCVQAMC